MRATISFVVVLLAILPSRAQESGQKAQAPDKTADCYPLKAGTTWHYVGQLGNGRKFLFLDRVGKIKEVDGKRLVRVETLVNGDVKSVEEISIEAGGVFRHSTDEVPVSPPERLLKYPVKEGETWNAELKIGDKPTTLTVKTGKWEKVDVPAGTYQAISVQTDMTSSGSESRITTWFAPEVGIIKQTIDGPRSHIQRELSKYVPGK